MIVVEDIVNNIGKWKCNHFHLSLDIPLWKTFWLDNWISTCNKPCWTLPWLEVGVPRGRDDWLCIQNERVLASYFFQTPLQQHWCSPMVHGIQEVDSWTFRFSITVFLLYNFSCQEFVIRKLLMLQKCKENELKMLQNVSIKLSHSKSITWNVSFKMSHSNV